MFAALRALSARVGSRPALRGRRMHGVQGHVVRRGRTGWRMREASSAVMCDRSRESARGALALVGARAWSRSTPHDSTPCSRPRTATCVQHKPYDSPAKMKLQNLGVERNQKKPRRVRIYKELDSARDAKHSNYIQNTQFRKVRNHAWSAHRRRCLWRLRMYLNGT